MKSDSSHGERQRQRQSSHDYAYVRDMRIVPIFVNGVVKVEIKVDYDSANDTPSKDKAGLAIKVTSPHLTTDSDFRFRRILPPC
jgi:hypothetical protein